MRLAAALRAMHAEPSIEDPRPFCREDFECLRLRLRDTYDHVIPLLSKAYCSDDFSTDELWAAFALNENTKPGFLVPAMIGDCKMPLPTVLQERLTDFRNVLFEDAFEELTKRLSSSRQVFVTMTAQNPQLETVYKTAIQPAIEQAGFSARTIACNESHEIEGQVLREIDRSAVVFVDLSGERSNSYLELGYSLAKGKELVLAIRENEPVPLNLGGRRITRWRDPEVFYEELLLWFSEVSERLSAVSKSDHGLLQSWCARPAHRPHGVTICERLPGGPAESSHAQAARAQGRAHRP